MKKLCAVLLLGTLSAPVACGGKVLVDGIQEGGGLGGAGGAGAASCPSVPGHDDVKGLVGKSCDADAMVCRSCGGCSVTCKNGSWVPTGATLCIPAGPPC